MNLEIDEVRDQYRSTAIRGSLLYFVVADLPKIDPMYQFSLQFVKRKIVYAMHQAAESDILEERVKNLQDTITRVLYTNVCRGLFSKHKLIFSFLISTQIKRQLKIISEKSWISLLMSWGVEVPQNSARDLMLEEARPN